MTIKPIKPKSVNQREYIRAILENDIVICTGPSGSGKSKIALHFALQNILSGNSVQRQLFITRPMVATSDREFPHLKGDLTEKLLPYFAPVIYLLEEILGDKKKVMDLINRETIVLQSIELMRGFTYKNAYVLITEAQNMSIPQSVMAITRIGENSKMIFEGDTNQKDLKGADGLSYLLGKLAKRPDLVGLAQLDYKDVVRHPIISKILIQLNYQGNLNEDCSTFN